ncbi:DUF4870 family protein [Marinobacter sp. C2H3]|uniref:DUF4870 family protein n=1 Tax=Marinobacter sp. C2H3 TaxID=3119003 RepID=UPI00300EB614
MPESEYIPAGGQRAARHPAHNLVVLVYILQALAFFTGGVTALVGVIINYVKVEDVRGTWLDSHFRWQIRTFWFALLWFVIGTVTTPLIIGWLILLAMAIWMIYRIVKGALALNDGRTV